MSTKANEILIDKIAKKYKLDKRVVAHVVRYPFLFTANVFRDGEDYTPIMFRYLGKFVTRYNITKKINGALPEDIKIPSTDKESSN